MVRVFYIFIVWFFFFFFFMSMHAPTKVVTEDKLSLIFYFFFFLPPPPPPPPLQNSTMDTTMMMMMSWCLMSSDVIWHIRDKLWPMPKHGSIKSTYVRCMRVLAVTCHLHFWQNDRDFLRATAVTRGWNGYRNKSQHRKSTLEKKILPPFQQGFEPATFQSRVRCSNHWAIPAPRDTTRRKDWICTHTVKHTFMVFNMLSDVRCVRY